MFREDDYNKFEPIHKPLTKWKNEPTIIDLKHDQEGAEVLHNTQILKIEENLRALDGELSDELKKHIGKNKSTFVPKLIKKQMEWRKSSLKEPFLNNNKMVELSPVGEDDVHAARYNQIILNNHWNTKIDKEQFIDDLIDTVAEEATAVVQVGWIEKREVVTEIIETPIPDIDPMSGEPRIDENGELVLLGVDRREVEAEKLVKNHPDIKVLDYRNIMFDPTSEGKLENSKFAIVKSYPTRSELEARGFKNLDLIHLENDSELARPDQIEEESNDFKFKDKARQKITMYDYWGYYDVHGDGKLVPIVASYINDVIVRMEENPYPHKQLPFVVVKYNSKRGSMYGVNDIDLINDNQEIIGALTRGMLDVMAASSNGQRGIDESALDAGNLRRFKDGKDFMYRSEIDPNKAFHITKYSEIPQSAQILVQQQQAEAEGLTGVVAYSQGMNGGSIGSTATGIKSTLDSAGKRELNIHRRIAKGIVKINRLILGMYSEFLSEEEMVRITDSNFVKIKRDDLMGEADIRMKISTAESDAAKSKDLGFVTQTVGAKLPPEQQNQVFGQLMDLYGLPELADHFRTYQPPAPSETQIKMEQLAIREKELELMKLEVEIAERQSRTTENQIDAELKSAKAVNERAKARKVGSEADKIDQEFVSQVETGSQAISSGSESVKGFKNQEPNTGIAIPGQNML